MITLEVAEISNITLSKILRKDSSPEAWQD